MKVVDFFKRHPIIFMIAYTLFHFAFFTVLEATVDADEAYVIHCKLDDYIPFCEYFIVPYLLWFLYIPAVLFSLFSRILTPSGK